MFFRRTSVNSRKPLAGPTGNRPASFRPALEGLEDRCLLSSTTYSDTLLAWGTGAGTTGRNAFYYDTQGALAGKLPGSFSSHIQYNGILGRGASAITGGTLAVRVAGWGAAAGTLQGRVAGGSIQWNAPGWGAPVTIYYAITGGTGAYAHETGTATFRGTMDRASQVLSGAWTVTLVNPSFHPPQAPPPRTPPPSWATNYTDTLQATGTGAGSAGNNTFYFDTRGTLAGKLPGTFSTRVFYTGILGNSTNAITGGTWSANITGSAGTAGTLQGRVAGGSVRWSSSGRAGAVTTTFTVTGGTGPYAGETGTGVFQGTMDWDTQALTGTLTLTLKRA
jgi:hypothetical protein